MKILCVNAGSSSLKYQVYEMPEERNLISGYVEKIGQSDSFWTIKVNGEKIKGEKYLKDHTEAAKVMVESLFSNNIISDISEIKGIGHRVLHGGEKYSDSVLITDDVIRDIESLTKLGPLHHPGNLAGIYSMKETFKDTPMVAVFDTAFHQTMPKKNYIYPTPYSWYEDYGVRKYGFHGTSHKYITMKMKEILGRDDINIINCHIGSGSSIACVKNSNCYDTTMGLTPLDGLMMGTRSGSIDPSILEYVCKESGKTISEITNDLNKKSGFLGVCGEADCRDVENLVNEGNELAKLAYEMYTDRVAKYIADYYVELDGNVDAIVFTAGIGENGYLFRKKVIEKIKCLGITLNDEENEKIALFKDLHEGVISLSDSKIPVYVVPTNEEAMIIKDTYELIK